MRTLWRQIAVTLPWLALAVPMTAQTAHREPWTAVSSPHFTLYTNAEAARGVEIATNLERFRAVFAQLSPQLELNSPAPTKILAFRDAESYAPYKTVADRGKSRILGQFLSHADGNYLTLDAGTRLVGSFDVIYHEYVHYFVRHNFPGVPLWFHEGLAEYYSTFATDGEWAQVGRPVARHVRWLHRGELDLDQVLAVTASGRHGDFAAGGFYAASWALVHYLLSGEAEQLDRVADFFLRPEGGEDPAAAFEAAFDLRLSQLEERLSRYLLEGELPQARIPLERLPPPAVEVREMAPQEALFHLGDLLAHIGRDAAAERHFQLALDHQADHAEAHAGLALVRDLQNRFEEAELLYRDAVELGSSSPLTYLLYGRHLLKWATIHAEPEARRGNVELARLTLRRVVELDPGFGEGWALLGRAHMYGDGDAEAGIHALGRARELLPERWDLVFFELQLHLRQGRVDRAQRLVGILALRAGAELVDEARGMVERTRLLRAADEAFEDNEIDAGLAYFDRAISLTADPSRRREMEQTLLALQERYRQ